jgi:hypothetical protein
MAKHVDVTLTDTQIRDAAHRLFGGTQTFRRGQIGGWRQHFKPEHIAAFKDVTGDLVVNLGYELSLDWS